MNSFPLDKLVEFIAQFIKNLLDNFARMQAWAEEFLGGDEEETTAAK